MNESYASGNQMSETENLMKLNQDLIQGKQRKPFVQIASRLRKFDKIKHCLQTDLENSQRILLHKHERFGPHQINKEKFKNKFHPIKKPTLNPNYVGNGLLKSQVPVADNIQDQLFKSIESQKRSLSFTMQTAFKSSRTAKPLDGAIPNSSFLSPNVLDRLKRFRWDVSQQLSPLGTRSFYDQMTSQQTMQR